MISRGIQRRKCRSTPPTRTLKGLAETRDIDILPRFLLANVPSAPHEMSTTSSTYSQPTADNMTTVLVVHIIWAPVPHIAANTVGGNWVGGIHCPDSDPAMLLNILEHSSSVSRSYILLLLPRKVPEPIAK
jgi:hypothetical protein